LRRKEHPSVSLAFPPVGWQSTVWQPGQTTTVWEWLNTVVLQSQYRGSVQCPLPKQWKWEQILPICYNQQTSGKSILQWYTDRLHLSTAKSIHMQNWTQYGQVWKNKCKCPVRLISYLSKRMDTGVIQEPSRHQPKPVGCNDKANGDP